MVQLSGQIIFYKLQEKLQQTNRLINKLTISITNKLQSALSGLPSPKTTLK